MQGAAEGILKAAQPKNDSFATVKNQFPFPAVPGF